MDVHLKGHRMRAGDTFAYDLKAHSPGQKARVAGSVICECGAYSPSLPSEIDRTNWHRRHLDDVISGKTRLL